MWQAVQAPNLLPLSLCYLHWVLKELLGMLILPRFFSQTDVFGRPGCILFVLSLLPYRSRKEKRRVGICRGRESAGAGRWAVCAGALSGPKGGRLLLLSSAQSSYQSRQRGALVFVAPRVARVPPEKTLLTSCVSAALALNLPISSTDAILIIRLLPCRLQRSSRSQRPGPRFTLGASGHLPRRLAHGVLHQCWGAGRCRWAASAPPSEA